MAVLKRLKQDLSHENFHKKEGIDYEETFAPVARYTYIRIVLSLAAKMKWKLHHMHIKTTCLNGVIEEEVFIEQPPGFETHDKETHVCILKKDIYGLNQAPKAWYGRTDGFLLNLCFTKSKADSNLYYKVENDEIMILLLYVDDLFLTGKEKLINKCKKKLAQNLS